MEVDRLVLGGLVLLVECLEDEDDSNEHRKAFLGEASDVAHQRAQIERDHHQQHARQPHTDPEPQLQIVDAVASTHSTAQHSKWTVYITRKSTVKSNYHICKVPQPDDKLFAKIVHNSAHVLQPLIPDRPPPSYDLRPCTHDKLTSA